MKQLLTQSFNRRLLSAIILIPAIVAIIALGTYPFGALLGVMGGLALREFWVLAKRSQVRWALIIAGGAYILFGAFLLYHLRETYSVWHSFLFFFLMWGSDSAAYFAGKMIGGAKMTPVLSPNKTWAGYGGALLAPVILLAIVGLRIDWIVLFGGLALGIAGQAGDLLISWLKRDVKVKDTGSLIPGHGGVLDRIDSLLPALPVYLALIKLGGVF